MLRTLHDRDQVGPQAVGNAAHKRDVKLHNN